MKAKLVVGNWKMNGRLADNRELLFAIRGGVPGGVDCAVCPPFPYLAQSAEALVDSPVRLGAQNLSRFGDGACTGEVSSGMLVDLGCRYVIVGHSERRALFGETSDEVGHKARVAIEAGLSPIVCVGETLAQREAGEVEAVLSAQLDALYEVIGSDGLDSSVIAYEPVWAIGTGQSATAEQVQGVLGWVRGWLARRLGSERAGAARVLYGGSVKPDNAAELFALPDCDGGLIGGASLKADEFLGICRAAAG